MYFSLCVFYFIKLRKKFGVKRSVTSVQGGTIGYAEIIAIKVLHRTNYIPLHPMRNSLYTYIYYVSTFQSFSLNFMVEAKQNEQNAIS